MNDQKKSKSEHGPEINLDMMYLGVIKKITDTDNGHLMCAGAMGIFYLAEMKGALESIGQNYWAENFRTFISKDEYLDADEYLRKNYLDYRTQAVKKNSVIADSAAPERKTIGFLSQNDNSETEEILASLAEAPQEGYAISDEDRKKLITIGKMLYISLPMFGFKVEFRKEDVARAVVVVGTDYKKTLKAASSSKRVTYEVIEFITLCSRAQKKQE